MSLQVWLPLTKDLRNQGLSNVTVTNNGATFNSAGKLGGSYEFASGKRIQTTLPATSSLNSKAISFACWVNISSWNSSYDCLMSIADGTGWQQSRATLSRNNTASTLTWNIADGSTSTRVSTTTSLSTNTWYHIACTYDGASLKIYVNGILDNSVAATLSIGYAGTFNIGGWSGNNYPINCKMNDVRVYSHCLSPIEVKELSKGLVLHYPLNRQGWGQENLMPNSVEMPLGSSNATTGTWRTAGSSAMTRSRVAITDSPVGSSAYGFQSVGLQTNQDASCWGIDGFPKENGTTYTISAWGRIVGGSSTAAMLGFSLYNATTIDYGGSYGKAVSSDTIYYGSGAYDYAGGRLNPNGNWTKVYRTFTSTATSGNIYVGFNTATTGSNVTVQVCGVKLEKGDKMTPWVPNSEETIYTTLGLNGTTEYDCSGFCNNGTRTGTFTWTSDTPKYCVSTAFEKGIISIPNSFVTTADPVFSVSLWFKLKSGITYTAYTDLISFSSSSYSNQPFRLELCGTPVGKSIMWFRGPSGQSGGFAVKTDISTDEWYHTVLVSEGNKQYSYYINGEKLGTYNGSANSWTPTGNVSLGENINGVFYESDFRIYATALSADDILELYHTAAYIDNVGNTYVYQYIET